jgi:hypothetical protein
MDPAASDPEGPLLGKLREGIAKRVKLGVFSALLTAIVSLYLIKESCSQHDELSQVPPSTRKLITGSAEFTIRFPFADAHMTQPMFSTSDLGAVFSRKHGLVSPQRAFVHDRFSDNWIHTGDPVAHKIHDEQTILKTEEGALDFLHIDGSLSVQYGLIRGEGSGFFQSLKSSSSMEFSVIQQSVVVKEADWIDVATITAAVFNEGKPFLNPLLDKPENVEQFWDTNGEMFVKRLLRGGIARRIIRYRFEDTKTAQEVKAHLAGKIQVGLFDINFEANFKSNNTQYSNRVEISIETNAVGGDPSILRETHDVKEAVQQLDRWKESVLNSDKPTAVVRVILSPLNAQVIPALSFPQYQMDLYFAHVQRTQRKLWNDEMIRAQMEDSTEKAKHEMTLAKFTEARKGQAVKGIKAAQRLVNEKWLRTRDRDIINYFAKSATQIWQTDCCNFTTSVAKESKYRKIADDLVGKALLNFHYTEGNSKWRMQWNGKACPATDGVAGGKVGRPELVEVFYPEGRKVFHVYGDGWNIREDRICETQKMSCSGSKVVAFIEIEDVRELPKQLPRALTMKYVSEKRYRNGDIYEGYWSEYLRDGLGSMRYSNKALYKGYWRAGIREGHGHYEDELGASYDGVWRNDKRQGTFKVRKNKLSSDLKLRFANDTWVVENMTAVQVQFKYATNLPDAMWSPWSHWMGIKLPYAAELGRRAGTYTGAMKMGVRDGHGIMEFDDGTLAHEEWQEGILIRQQV